MVEPSSRWRTDLKHKFWEKAGARYHGLRWIMPDNKLPDWQTFASYAGRHGMSTDTVYLSRADKKHLDAAKARALDTLATGRFERDVLYILDREKRLPALNHLSLDTDLLAEIDGFSVIAPGWKTCSECMRDVTVTELFQPVRLGRTVWFSRAGRSSKYLGNGWSLPERWGVWSDGDTADLVLPVFDIPTSIRIDAYPFVNQAHPRQNVEVRMNGVPVFFDMTRESNSQVTVRIPGKVRESLKSTRYLRLEFKFANAVRPIDVGPSKDTRRLALGLVGITLSRAVP